MKLPLITQLLTRAQAKKAGYLKGNAGKGRGSELWGFESSNGAEELPATAAELNGLASWRTARADLKWRVLEYFEEK